MTNHENQAYPRALSPREQELIAWVLPSDRPGYAAFGELLRTMVVIGEGRRGEGEIILAPGGSVPDFSAPLGAVYSYGAVETNFGVISVTVREPVDGQFSVEIVSQRSDRVPPEYEEARRWTYALWNPGEPCPQCLTGMREVPMRAGEGLRFVLALCARDRRLWVHDGAQRINRLIPVTNFYNEIMLHKNIRDPKIALDHKRFFAELERYSDADLSHAFQTYNALKAKVRIEGAVEPELPGRGGVLATLKKLLSR